MDSDSELTIKLNELKAMKMMILQNDNNELQAKETISWKGNARFTNYKGY